jgi:hypothetical protein
MKQYGLAANQVEDYKASVHAKALHDRGDTTAPTCNDCHGSHGAVPPGIGSIANICGSCHGREATLFRETEAKKDLNLEACIQCMVCHDNHKVLPPTDAMLGVGPESTCTSCHAEGDKEYDAAAQMGEAVVKLDHRLSEARELLERAERAGVEVSPDLFALQTAQDKLVESRVLAHSFDLDRFMTVANEGLAAADAGIAAGGRAFTELQYRRIGLAASLVVIGALIVGLVFKVRQLERTSTRH